MVMSLRAEIKQLTKEKEEILERHDIEVMTVESLEEYLMKLEIDHTNIINEFEKEHQLLKNENQELKVKCFKYHKSKELDKYEIQTLKKENIELKEDAVKLKSGQTYQRKKFDEEVTALKLQINNLSKENKD